MMKFDKKDGVYIFSILVVICIILLSRDLADITGFSNYLSFGSNLFTIALSIIAIIYAFNQSGESSRQNERVQDALNVINVKIEQLMSLKDDLLSVSKDISVRMSDIQKLTEDFQNNVVKVMENDGELPSDIKVQLENIQDKIYDLTKNQGQITLPNFYGSSNTDGHPLAGNAYVDNRNHF